MNKKQKEIILERMDKAMKENQELSNMAYRQSAASAIKSRIERLRKEADDLEALLNIIARPDREDILSPEADEALWRLAVSRY